MVSAQGQSLYGGPRGFVRVESEEKQPPPREVQGSGVELVSTLPSSRTDSSQDGTAAVRTSTAFGIAWRFRKAQASPMLGTILLYMSVSMSLTLLDKWLITGLGFDAPLCLIMLTYFIMHLASSLIRQCSRRQGGSPGGEKQVLLQTLTFSQWAWKVFPVAAASGLEVGTSTLGLQVMNVGVHTMVRSTVPIFVLLFSVGLGLQEFRVGLLVVVLLVSGGVSLLFSGQKHDNEVTFPMSGFLLTLLSGMLAGLKWTLSQVLLQGKGLCGRGHEVVGEVLHPFTLLHYMSLSSAGTLVPFVAVLEVGNLRDMAIAFGMARIVKTLLLIAAASLLALVLVLTEFAFIKKVSSLGLCIIGVVKELLLVLFSVAFLGEHLGGRSCLGFSVTMVGVGLYKLVPKRSPQGIADAGVAASPTPRGGREAPDHPLLLVGTVSDARHRHVEHFSLEPKVVEIREGSGGGDAKAYRRELHDAGVSESVGSGEPVSSGSNA